MRAEQIVGRRIIARRHEHARRARQRDEVRRAQGARRADVAELVDGAVKLASRRRARAAASTRLARGEEPAPAGSAARARARARALRARLRFSPRQRCASALRRERRPSTSPSAPHEMPAIGAAPNTLPEVVALERLRGGAAIEGNRALWLAAALEVLGEDDRLRFAVLLEPLRRQLVAERAVLVGEHRVRRLGDERVPKVTYSLLRS